LAKLEIVGSVDFTHSTFAEKTNDPVTAREDGSGDKTGVVDRVE
jgi:hypothetical protein